MKAILKKLAGLLLVRTIAASSHSSDSESTRWPSNLPESVPLELEMLYGFEAIENGTDDGDTAGYDVEDDIWYVPHKHYKMVRLELFNNEYHMSGFRVVYDVEDSESTPGWSQEEHLFGSEFFDANASAFYMNIDVSQISQEWREV